ncbi:MAG: copper-binding protein, partial [Planctomycetota bacterium]
NVAEIRVESNFLPGTAAYLARMNTYTKLSTLAILGLASLTGCPRVEVEVVPLPGIDLADPATKTYDVRGFVDALPDPSQSASEFRIDHEEIPDFVNVEGEVSGMKAMVMPFPLAPGVSIDKLSVGDPVAFTFAVNWEAEASYPWELTAITKLEPSEAEGIVASKTP